MESETAELLKVRDIRIFPHRFLKAQTTEDILNQIYDLDGIVRVLIHGPSIPKTVTFGPAKGLAVNHDQRRSIGVHGSKIDLRVAVGEIIITVEMEKSDEFLSRLKSILDGTLSFGYQLDIGKFTKSQPSTSDYMKYGSNLDALKDSRCCGMVDMGAKSSDSINFIKD